MTICNPGFLSGDGNYRVISFASGDAPRHLLFRPCSLSLLNGCHDLRIGKVFLECCIGDVIHATWVEVSEHILGNLRGFDCAASVGLNHRKYPFLRNIAFLEPLCEDVTVSDLSKNEEKN